MFMLIDCDNFFVSCERIFRPGLKNRPVVVPSSKRRLRHRPLL